MYRKHICFAAALISIFAAFSTPAVSFAGIQETAMSHPHPKRQFYLHNGDRVVFYGDSITDQRMYTLYIESYCVSRFPKLNLSFVHSGWGGDRVTGGGGGDIELRLRRDVLIYKPTVVTICLGMNDGSYRPYFQQGFDTYFNGYRHIIETLLNKLPGVRITLLTTPAFDDVSRAQGFPGGYNGVLTAYSEGVKSLAREYGLTVADTNAPLVAVISRSVVADPQLAAKIIPDRVHPGFGGHIVMASAVLKAWNAPETVADVAIDAAERTVTKSENTRISDLEISPEKITFTEKDESLPWPIDRDPKKNLDTQLVLQQTDLETSLDRFALQLSGLGSTEYRLKIDGQDMGAFTKAELSNGLDLAAMPDLPQNRDAAELLSLTRKRGDLHNRRWREVQTPHAKNGDEVSADIKKQMDDLDALEASAARAQHLAASPHAHKFELVVIR